jgi:hypothetical protein
MTRDGFTANTSKKFPGVPPEASGERNISVQNNMTRGHRPFVMIIFLKVR